MKKIIAVVSAVICLIAVVVTFQLTYFHSTVVFGYDGVVISDEKLTNNLMTIPEDTATTLVEPAAVKASDMIYERNGSLYYGDNSKTKFLQEYPTFINQGKALLMLNDKATLIDQYFREQATFSNLVLTGGGLYQANTNSLIDDNVYYFLKLSNGFYINSLEMKIKTNLREYLFEMNSIHNFTETSILSYKYTSQGFQYSTITDVDLDSVISIGNTEMTYKEFLSKLSLYSEPTPKAERDQTSSDTSSEEVSSAPEESPSSNNAASAPQTNTSSGSQGEFPSTPYEKPRVIVSDFLPVPYGMTSKLTIIDSGNKMRSAVTFYIYEGDSLVLRKSFRADSDLLFENLKPGKEYRVKAQYEYIDANGQRTTDEFLDINVKTSSLSADDIISLNGEMGTVNFDSFILNNVAITSDISTYAVKYLQDLKVQVGDLTYSVPASDLTKLKSGQSISVVFPQMLTSNTDYTVTLKGYDRFGNEIPLQFEDLKIHTPKKLPDVTYNFEQKEIDYLKIKYSISDTDNVNPQAGKFQLYTVDAQGNADQLVEEINQSDVTDDTLEFNDPTFSSEYILRYVGTVDLVDGKGEQTDYTIKDYKFLSSSLSQLGVIYLNMTATKYTEEDSYTTLDGTIEENKNTYAFKIGKDTSYKATFTVDQALSSTRLLELIDKLNLELYTRDEEGNKVSVRTESFVAGSTEFDAVKAKGSFTKEFTDLQPNTQYFLDFKGEYRTRNMNVSMNLNYFRTWKTMPTASLTNLVTTSTHLYATAAVADPDRVSNAGRAMVVLNTYNEAGETDQDKLTGGTAIDVAYLKTNNADGEKISLKGLTAGQKYVLNYYISDTNWSSNSVNLVDKKIYLHSYIFTAQDNLDGKVKVADITTNSTNNNQIDVKLSTSFYDKTGLGDGKIYVDIYDENDNKLNDKSYSNSYTSGSNTVTHEQTITLPKEDKTYTAKLYTISKTFGHIMELSETQFNTKDAVKLIHNMKELYDINGQSGRYRVVNDLAYNESGAPNHQTISSFLGELDFDGHELKFAYSNTVRALFGTLQEGSVVKNLNLNITENNSTNTLYGIAQTNYGTIQELYLRTVGEKTIAANFNRSYLVGTNYGVIDTFVVYAAAGNSTVDGSGIIGEHNVSMGVVTNNGTIRNGYFDGAPINLRWGASVRNNRRAGIVAATNNSSGIIENIYVLNEFKGHGTYPSTLYSAVAVGSNAGTVKNLYTTKPAVNYSPDNVGVAVGTSTGTTSDVYYIHNSQRNNTANQRTNYEQLGSASFQSAVLNTQEKFDVERYVYNGYYPHIAFQNENMPTQALNPLPTITDTAKVSYINYDIEQEPNDPMSSDYHAILKIRVKNLYAYTVTGLTFDNLYAQILEQIDDAQNGESILRVKINTKQDGEFVDSHLLQTISFRDDLANELTTEYPTDSQRTLMTVRFYRTVNNIDDWKYINDHGNQNYYVTSDIDFMNIENAAYITTFSGNLEGNGHTVSAIKIKHENTTTPRKGVIGTMNGGSINNLTFKSVEIDAQLNQQNANGDIGIISLVQGDGQIRNVHVYDSTIKGSTSVGGLVGNLYGQVYDSSVHNTTIDSKVDRQYTMNIGGLVGQLQNNGVIQSSYVQGVTITTQKNESLNAGWTVSRVGGVLGNAAGNGIIQNVYAITTINAPTSSMVAGIVGTLNSGGKLDINGVFAKSDIVASSHAGGIIGLDNQRGTVTGSGTYTSSVVNGFFTGSIVATSNVTFGVGSNSNEHATNLYTHSSARLNGLGVTDSTKGTNVTIIDDSQFSSADVYTKTIGLGSAFDTSKVATTDGKFLLPKVNKLDGSGLVAGQVDNEFTKSDVYFQSLDITKDTTYAQTGKLTIKLFNKNTSKIKAVTFKDDMISTTGEATTSHDSTTNIMTYEVTVTPKYFVNTYYISTIVYEDGSGTDQTLNLNTAINTKFYRQISKPEEWPTTTNKTTYAENYYITNDLDFSTVVGTDLNKFRERFNVNVYDVHTSSGSSKTIKLGGSPITSLTPNQDFIFKSVAGEMKDLTFDTIKMEYNSQTNNLSGIIGQNTGTITNVTFKNIEITHKNGTTSYGTDGVGMIGQHNGGTVKNITVSGTNKVIVENGGHMVGLLIGRVGGGTLSDITVSGVNTVKGHENVGGVIGGVSGISSPITNIKVNMDGVSENGDSPIASDATNTLTVEATGSTPKQMGGVIGLHNASGSTLSNIEANNIEIKGLKGSHRNVDAGGILGQTRNATLSNSKAFNIKVTGETSNSVGRIGGVIGYISTGNNTTFTINGLKVYNIQTQAGLVEYSGGIIGQNNQAQLAISNITGSKITVNSPNNVGGLIGHMGYNMTANISDVDVTDVTVNNTSTGQYVGGMIAIVEGSTAIINNSYLRNLTIKTSSGTKDNKGVGGFIGYLSTPGTGNRITNSGLLVKEISSKNGGFTGGVVGKMQNNNVRLTFENSYVVGTSTTQQKAKIEGTSNTGGIVGEMSNDSNMLLTVNNSYVAADITTTNGHAGMLGGSTNHTTVNGFISLGSATAAGNNRNAGGIIGNINSSGVNTSLTSILVVADVKGPNNSVASFIGQLTNSNPSYSNAYLYEGSKVNDILVKTQYANDDLYKDRMLDSTKMKDGSTYSSMINLGSVWNYGNVSTLVAPRLNNLQHQFDITMFTETTADPTPDNNSKMMQFAAEEKAATVAQATALPSIQAYASAAGKVNVEFGFTDDSMQFAIVQNGQTLQTQALQNRVYTLSYNYQEAFDVVVTAATGEQTTYTVEPQKIARYAYVDDNGYYYISTNGAIMGSRSIGGNYLNLYKGQALDDQGNILTLAGQSKTGQIEQNLAIEEQTEPLFTFDKDGTTIATYQNFSTVGGQTRVGNLYLKKDSLSMIDAKLGATADSVIIDEVNGKQIQTVLKNGALLNLGNDMLLPEGFENRNIRYVTTNLNHESGIAIVDYEDGAKLIFNYRTGDVVQNQDAPFENKGLFSFITDNLNLDFFSVEPSLKAKYTAAKETADSLMAAPQLTSILNENAGQHSAQTTGTAGSSALNTTQLLPVYNPTTNNYDLYDANELVNPDVPEEAVQNLEEKSEVKGALKVLMDAKTVTPQSNYVYNYAIFTGILVLIGGCMFFIIRQRRKINAKKSA